MLRRRILLVQMPRPFARDAGWAWAVIIEFLEIYQPAHAHRARTARSSASRQVRRGLLVIRIVIDVRQYVLHLCQMAMGPHQVERLLRDIEGATDRQHPYNVLRKMLDDIGWFDEVCSSRAARRVTVM